MSRVVLELPEHSMRALGWTADAAGAELRLTAAMKLYEMGRLSSGAAAEFAGIPKPLFLHRMGDFGIPAFDLSEEELRADVEAAKNASRHG